MVEYTPEMKAMCLRINIPQHYWGSVLDQIPPSIHDYFNGFIKDLDYYIAQGAGFFISGSPGIGKSSACVYMAKLIKTSINPLQKKYYSCYFMKANDIRDKFKSKEAFDGEQVVFDRCKEVDFLVIDDLSENEANASWPGPQIFTDLLSHRTLTSRSTFITTNLTKAQIIKTFPDMAKAALGHMVYITAEGTNRRLEKQSALEQRLIKQ